MAPRRLRLSGNSESVTIVAYATAAPIQNVVAPIAITAFGSNLIGTYVLQAQGVDTSLGPYQFAGVIVLNGDGNNAASYLRIREIRRKKQKLPIRIGGL